VDDVDRADGALRRRLVAVVVVPVVVLVGLTSRAVSSGPSGSALGDILYATLVYVLVVLVVPRVRPAAVAVVALVLCWFVELAQLTGGPAALAEAWWPLRYLLGTSFVWTDLVLYALGVLLGLVADVSARTTAVRRHRGDAPAG